MKFKRHGKTGMLVSLFFVPFICLRINLISGKYSQQCNIYLIWEDLRGLGLVCVFFLDIQVINRSLVRFGHMRMRIRMWEKEHDGVCQ